MQRFASRAALALLMLSACKGGTPGSTLLDSVPPGMEFVGQIKFSTADDTEAYRSLLEGLGFTPEGLRSRFDALGLSPDLEAVFCGTVDDGRPSGALIFARASVRDPNTISSALGLIPNANAIAMATHGDLFALGHGEVVELWRAHAADPHASPFTSPLQKALRHVDTEAPLWLTIDLEHTLPPSSRPSVQALGDPTACALSIALGDTAVMAASLVLPNDDSAEGLALKAKTLLSAGARHAKNEHDAIIFQRARIDFDGDVLTAKVDIEAQRLWEMVAAPRMLLGRIGSAHKAGREDAP